MSTIGHGLRALRLRVAALSPRERAIALGGLAAALALAVVGSLVILTGANAPGTGAAPGTGTDGAVAGSPGTPTPEVSFTPAPLPEASIVAALPPPVDAPISAVIASPVAAARTRAPATPTPSPDPNVWRVEGVIVADDTKLPLHEVCIVIGPHGCQRGSIRTDNRGVFAIDVPKNPTVFYDLYFVKDGFWTVWMRIKPEGPSVYNVALTKS